eukprot:EG_transcript_16991
MEVAAVTIYPIKSCKGMAVTEAAVAATGFQYDRQWMVVNAAGFGVTQRAYPRMALVAPTVHPGGALLVTAPGMAPLTVRPEDGGSVASATWHGTVAATDMGDAAAQWFAQFLGAEGLRLVYFGPKAQRVADEGQTYYVRHLGLARDVPVQFPDEYPYLIATEASLAAVNAGLRERCPNPEQFRPLNMNRFRPNVVIRGNQPFEEDEWDELRIGSVTFRLVKGMSRCKMPTIDQETAEMMAEDQPENPQRYLRDKRDYGRGPLFGQGALTLETGGRVRPGDPVTVVSRKPLRQQAEDKGPLPRPWQRQRRPTWLFLGASVLVAMVLHASQKQG